MPVIIWGIGAVLSAAGLAFGFKEFNERLDIEKTIRASKKQERENLMKEITDLEDSLNFDFKHN